MIYPMYSKFSTAKIRYNGYAFEKHPQTHR